MQLIRKFIVLASFAMFVFPNAVSAQGGYGMGGPGGMGGMMGGFEESPSQLDLAKQKLMNAKNDEQRKKLVKVIRNELVDQYDKYLKQNQAQINQLQSRLDGLKKQLKTRIDAKDQLVTLELTRIVNESKGLSWPSNQSNGGYGMDDFGGGMSGMGGGIGMGGGPGGVGMGGPGMMMGMGGGMDVPSNAAGMEGDMFGGDATVHIPQASDEGDGDIEEPMTPDQISENNLRQIALACFNFESANKRFPSNRLDLDDKPLLSWRVAILPYIEENELYKKFRLDEPWNSEHNIALAAEMPEVFKSPGFENKLKTLMQGFDAPGTVFESGKKVTFGQMTDGSSNTILCVESAEDKAVIWTKPQDLKGGEGTKVEDLFRFNRHVTRQVDESTRMVVCEKSPIVRCDGSTDWIRSDSSEIDIEGVITMNDGRVLDDKQVYVSKMKDAERK